MIHRKRKVLCSHANNAIVLYIMFMIAKIAMEFCYIKTLANDIITYPLHFSVEKYIYGVFCLFIIYALIDHRRNNAKPSSFLLKFFFIMEMVPFTIIYEMQNESTLYYTCIVLAICICEVIVLVARPIRGDIIIKHLNKIIIALFTISMFFFMFKIYRSNGLPTTTALNIYDVYELRESGIYHLSKYMGYIQSLVVFVIIPILLTIFINKKKYLCALIALIVEFAIYLYAGQKAFLFAGIMVVMVVVWAQRENFEREFFVTLCLGISTISVLAFNKFIFNFTTLIVRRVMIASANLKFKYFDFFSNNPKVGWAGILPRWILPINNYYAENDYSYTIADIYFGKPQMQANTGFLAEGFMRWGYLGLFISFVFLAIILVVIDEFARRTSNRIALGCSICVIFFLADGGIFGKLLFGEYTVWLLFLLFYREREKLFRNKKSDQITV